MFWVPVLHGFVKGGLSICSVITRLGGIFFGVRQMVPMQMTELDVFAVWADGQHVSDSGIGVAGRTFAQAGRCRGLARDHEGGDDAALGFFVLANAMLLVRRLAREL